MATPASTLTISARINFQRIQLQIEAAVMSVVNASAAKAYDYAQQKVPVRRIFKGGKRHFITLPRVTKENMAQARIEGTPEREAFLAVKAAREITDLPEGFEHYTPGRTIQTNRPWDNRDFPMPANLGRGLGSGRRGKNAERHDLRRQLLSDTLTGAGAFAVGQLSSKGRYELRTGRANYKGRVGGTLKGEMEVIRAENGPHFKASVVSPTRYAKFVEFGTRRSVAQPYLRPGLMHVQVSFREDMLHALQRAGRFGLPSGGKAGGQTQVFLREIGLAPAAAPSIGPILGPQPGQIGFTASQNEAIAGIAHLSDVLRGSRTT